MLKLLLLAHVGATFFMVGLIWFVQIVHYPLFDQVGREIFSAYETAHTRLTTYVVGPPMLIEAITAGLLLWLRPSGVMPWQVWLGAGLLAIVWLSTAFLQVPQHNILSVGFDPAAYRTLVATNWLRTVAWSLRGLLALSMIAGAMR